MKIQSNSLDQSKVNTELIRQKETILDNDKEIIDLLKDSISVEITNASDFIVKLIQF